MKFSVKGNQYRDNSGDCRSRGCPAGECIRQGNEFVCRQGKSFMFVAILDEFYGEKFDFRLKNYSLKCHPYYLSEYCS